MIILCFYNALDFQLEIIFSFMVVEKIKKFCFLTNHEEMLRKKFYLVMSGHSGFNFKKFTVNYLPWSSLKIVRYIYLINYFRHACFYPRKGRHILSKNVHKGKQLNCRKALL